MIKRSVILELELRKGEETRILGRLLDLCDHVEKWKDAGEIEDYGVSLVVPALGIKGLPMHATHGEPGTTE